MNEYSIFDAHCDTLCHTADKGVLISNNGCSIDKNYMLEYKKYTQVFACFIDPMYYDNPKARFDTLYKSFNAQDLSGINPILSLEGGEIIESLEDVEYLYDCGVRCATLTWNNTNKLAGGVDDADFGLTKFGKSVIGKMEELGILIDVSHLNDKSFYDVASVITRPIIATHSNSRALCEHRRNITDDMFNIIRDSGGCVGINFYPLFLTEKEKCTVDDAILHIEHFMSLDGENSIGIGSDFDGIPYTPKDLNNCGKLYRLLDILKEMGTQKELIEKISHKNFERVFGEE